MTLLEFHADLTRVANSLERIAFLLEKLVFPPQPADVQVHQATLDDLHVISPEDVERIRAEQTEFAERYNVVPDSPAMGREILAWEAEQRRIHGEEWKAPAAEEWKAIFARSYAAPGAGSDGEH